VCVNIRDLHGDGVNSAESAGILRDMSGKRESMRFLDRPLLISASVGCRLQALSRDVAATGCRWTVISAQSQVLNNS